MRGMRLPPCAGGASPLFVFFTQTPSPPGCTGPNPPGGGTGLLIPAAHIPHARKNGFFPPLHPLDVEKQIPGPANPKVGGGCGHLLLHGVDQGGVQGRRQSVSLRFLPPRGDQPEHLVDVGPIAPDKLLRLPFVQSQPRSFPRLFLHKGGEAVGSAEIAAGEGNPLRHAGPEGTRPLLGQLAHTRSTTRWAILR